MPTLKELVPIDSNGFCSGKYRRTSWRDGFYFEPRFIHSKEEATAVGIMNQGMLVEYSLCEDDWEVYSPQPVRRKIRVYKYIMQHYYDSENGSYSQKLTDAYFKSNLFPGKWIQAPHHFLDIEVEEGTDNVHVL